MATTGWRTDTPLDQYLFDGAHEFDFFQAVRLLERFVPDRKPVGSTARPTEETVHFRTWLSLAFPASAIDLIEKAPGAASGLARMTVTFAGLTGIQGVLPTFYTERLLEGKKGTDHPLVEFLDLFNHRWVSFFYRAWQKYHFPVLYEAAATRTREPDMLTRSLLHLIGMGTAGLQHRLQIPDESLLRYAGLLAQTPHSASALGGVLRDYFAVPVGIEQCLGSWYEIEEADRCYLAPEETRCQLGVGAFLGDRVWDQQARFRIRIGALDFTRFQDFLPDASGMVKLRQWTRQIVGLALAFDVQLVLKADEVPPLCLTDEGTSAARLGWSTWLKTKDFETDADDAVFACLN